MGESEIEEKLMESSQWGEIENERTRLIASAYAQGLKSEEVSKKYGISMEVLSKWKKDSVFRSYVEEYLQETRECIANKLLIAADKAASELKGFLGNPDVEEKYELAAIELILNLTLKQTESVSKVRIKGMSRETINNLKNQILYS